MQQIHHRLVLQEENYANQNANQNILNWVPKEAAELKYLPGYGTFSEALVCCVEEKVEPILAQLISEMDLNNNLMLIEGHHFEFFIDVWLGLFKFFCPKPYDLPKSIPKCEFPFSQQIMYFIDGLIDEIHFGNETGMVISHSSLISLVLLLF